MFWFFFSLSYSDLFEFLYIIFSCSLADQCIVFFCLCSNSYTITTMGSPKFIRACNPVKCAVVLTDLIF